MVYLNLALGVAFLVMSCLAMYWSFGKLLEEIINKKEDE